MTPIEKAAMLAKMATDCTALCREVLEAEFPAGEPLVLRGHHNPRSTQYALSRGPSDLIGQIDVLFENGNTWSKPPEILERLTWRELPKSYKKIFAKHRAEIYAAEANRVRKEEM